MSALRSAPTSDTWACSELVPGADQWRGKLLVTGRSEHRQGGEGVDDFAGELLVADELVGQLARVEPGADRPAGRGRLGDDLEVDRAVAGRPDPADRSQVHVPGGAAEVGEPEADEPARMDGTAGGEHAGHETA